MKNYSHDMQAEIIRMFAEKDWREELKEIRRRLAKKEQTIVKIALVGQPGAGKSSVINKLIGKELFETGVHTDTTVESKEVSWQDLKIADLPGYDTKRFPFEKWCEEFRVEDYDLYLFVFAGKLHDADTKLFTKFKEWNNVRKHPYFIVRNKEDNIWADGKTLEELKKEIEQDVRSKMSDNDVKVHFTSCRTGTGFEELKEDIFNSGIENVKKDKIIAAVKATCIADLDNKRKICLDKIDEYALVVAGNALNPFPGVDVAVDVTAFYKMAKKIRETFGLDETAVERYMTVLGPVFNKLANKVLEYLTKEGILLVIKQVAGRYVQKQALKWLPIVGQGFAAFAGFTMTKSLGESYINNCYEVAKEIMEYEIKNNMHRIEPSKRF